MSNKEIKDSLLTLINSKQYELLINKLKDYSVNQKVYPEQDDEYFKCAWQARSCDGKSYYVSNHGRIILTDEIADMEKVSKKYLENNKIEFKEVETHNGYLTKKGLPEDWDIALYTDVYVFVAEAFKEEFSDELNKLKDKFPEERLELHHINNNPNDNKLSNLIYLPKSIHARAHKYID